MLDYLVVGQGLAGTCFCDVLERHGKTFKVISDHSQQASVVAGGLYNPIILKRFSLAWKADEQMDRVNTFYEVLEAKLGVRLDYKIPVLRRFASIEEQNLWFEACDKPRLKNFLSPKLIQNQNAAIDAPHGFGEVLHTGRVDTKTLIASYKQHLLKKEMLWEAQFDHGALRKTDGGIAYDSITAKRIVFAEGFGLKKNPLFNYLPLNGTKGELLTIKAPDLKEKKVIKSSVFSIPLGNDLYRIGATYKWKDKTNVPTEASRNELLERLKHFLKCDFEVVDHVAGIRPTVTDRRPLVGGHPEFKNSYVLNGFGSRGVLIGPYASEQLYHHIENGEALDLEMSIERFQSMLNEG